MENTLTVRGPKSSLNDISGLGIILISFIIVNIDDFNVFDGRELIGQAPHICLLLVYAAIVDHNPNLLL